MSKKAKKRVQLPSIIYVQQIADGDDVYLSAWENLEDVDLDEGPIVGVYDLNRLVKVIEPSREVEEVK